MITFDQYLVNEALNWTENGWPVGNLILCLTALVLTIILVGIVGIEREWRGRSAGLRTHLLVGIGSCVVMIISIYGFPMGVGNRDVARLAAQVVTGVGFLGAGVIMHRENGVKGLTTAGTIWAAMTIGIACGSFNFILATVGTLLITVVLIFFKKIEAKIGKRNPTLVLEAPANEPVLERILTVSKEFDCTIHGVSTSLKGEGDAKRLEITFQVVFESNGGENRLIEYISKLEIETKAINIHQLNAHK